MFSTSEDVQFIGGYHEYIWGHHQCIGEILWVHWGGYYEYIGGDIMSTLGGDIMSTLGGIFMSTSGGYYEYIGGILWVHWGDIMSTSGDLQYIGRILWLMWGSKLIKAFHLCWKPQCTDHPRCTNDIPPIYWTQPDVLMISHPIYSLYPPDVLKTYYTGWFILILCMGWCT